MPLFKVRDRGLLFNPKKCQTLRITSHTQRGETLGRVLLLRYDQEAGMGATHFRNRGCSSPYSYVQNRCPLRLNFQKEFGRTSVKDTVRIIF